MAERCWKVMTAVGTDRPGLVNGISRLIQEAGANLEDSRMAILGGEFAIVVLYSGEGSALQRVTDRSAEVGEALGLQLVIKDTQAKTNTPSVRGYRLKVTGLDHPGIVQSVTGLLASREINVENFESRLTHAPMSGTPTFVLEARLQVPPSVSLAELRKELDALCGADQLDFALESTA